MGGNHVVGKDQGKLPLMSQGGKIFFLALSPPATVWYPSFFMQRFETFEKRL